MLIVSDCASVMMTYYPAHRESCQEGQPSIWRCPSPLGTKQIASYFYDDDVEYLHDDGRCCLKEACGWCWWISCCFVVQSWEKRKEWGDGKVSRREKWKTLVSNQCLLLYFPWGEWMIWWPLVLAAACQCQYQCQYQLQRPTTTSLRCAISNYNNASNGVELRSTVFPPSYWSEKPVRIGGRGGCLFSTSPNIPLDMTNEAIQTKVSSLLAQPSVKGFASQAIALIQRSQVLLISQ